MNAYRLNEHLQSFSFPSFGVSSNLKGHRRHHRVRETRFYKINNVQKKTNEGKVAEYSTEKFLICLYGKQRRSGK